MMTTPTTTTKKRLADDDNDNDDDDLRCSVFPRSSTTLITCASNSGKTWFLRQVMLNREVFIEAGKKIRRVVYVNCNQRDTQFSHPWEDAEEEDDDDDDDEDNDLKKKNEEEEEEEEEEENLIDLVSVGLHDLAGTREDLFDLVQPGDVVILDDLQTLTKSVEHLVNYGAHHYQLVVFLVTQSCLGSPLYSLLKSVHNLVLLFANNSASSLARHVKSTFFLSSDTRSCLEDIFAHAEKTKSTVVLKINSVATSPFHRSVLAFSGVENLFAEQQQKQRAGAGASAQRGEVTTFPFCAVYVETKYREDMLQASRTRKVRLPAAAGFASDEAFVLVPLQNVQVGKNDDDDDDDEEEEDRDDDNDVDDDDDGKKKKKKKKVCLRRQWDEMNRQLESEIETGFDFAKWNVAKNLMREVLKCPQVCISSDFRLAYVDRQEFSIIDFLQVATRKSGPGEVTASAARGSRRRPAPRDFVASFVPLLAVLLANHAPVSYVKNKRLHALTLNYMQSHPRRRSRRVPQ